jgi:natural product biosynthesis luciferase-like monooxygenase protein
MGKEMLKPSSDVGPMAWYPRNGLVHELFEAQARRTPGAIAVSCREGNWTFAELNAEANRAARYLVSQGVRPYDLVGLSVLRSRKMIMLQLAVLKAAAAYVPLDPAYPAERTRSMAADGDLRTILADASSSAHWVGSDARVVDVDALSQAAAELPADDLEVRIDAESLCWVLYTSGSTGKPKGVMVRHRNVVSFLGAMDLQLRCDPRSAWLAVTSISFDISVLEIFWPLTRGFRVVVWGGRDVLDAGDEPAGSSAPGFSLFFFANATHGDADPYRVLLDGARFADAHGFEAVWTPERHFHDFGGTYPNPSVAAAAVGAITKRIGIRAGSCVVPLHHPVRIAEEWAVVDRITGGRVGIAAAAGWNPNDFILRPEAYRDRKERLFSDIEIVRALWRGEAVPFLNPRGETVAVRTMPRPVQAELPIWITVAGNPDTFRVAAEHGYHVLTHLVGQTVDELTERIDEYRRVWREAGHAGRPRVALMIHTYIGEDEPSVRELVRAPMIEYLRTSFDLVKRAAWSFPTFKQEADREGVSISELLERRPLSPEEVEQLLEFSFERYYETGSLFGTPESCLSTVERLAAAGVDEIACLIDFGVEQERVLEQLPRLNRLRELASDRLRMDGTSIPALARLHGISHFQCTPTMARMLLMERGGTDMLAGLDMLLVGGEALPSTTAEALRIVTRGTMLNMYGPTETTIWSMAYQIERPGQKVLIGRAIANTEVHVVDEDLKVVPVGEVGEVCIGGDGVTAGYLNRPELTAERFVEGPRDAAAPARLYRTGDLARMLPDGQVEFLGRMDQQVKIRGFRVELGEIEATLSRCPCVADSAVVGRQGSLGETQLVAFVVPSLDTPLDVEALRAELRRTLPDFMVPARIVPVPSLPTTPNGKTDRATLTKVPLPRTEAGRTVPSSGGATRAGVASSSVSPSPLPSPEPATSVASPSDAGVDRARALAAIWSELLNRDAVNPSDNFFELGGNSLLAARMMSLIRERLGNRLPLTSLLRAPTLEKLLQRLEA